MTKTTNKILALVVAAACACSGGGDKGRAASPVSTCSAVGFAECPPALDPTVPTNLADASKFLYTGDDPPQKDVDAAALDLTHVAVVRGQVLTRSSAANAVNGTAPLAGVTVTILGHPEFGFTTTRSDGWFDMVANGGGPLVVDYALAGYLPAQRTVKTRWLDYGVAASAVLVQAEPGSSVTFSSGSRGFQVVRGLKHGTARTPTPTEDSDGARTATLLIPPGTTASPASLNEKPVTVHATELTTGTTGLMALPGDLPPTSAYTYALDFSIDEAEGASVSFNQPLVFYLENFVGFRVGDGTSATPMPMGFYDRTQGAWVPTPSGQVLRVLSNDGSTVELEADGKGTPVSDSELTPPLYPGERAQIAALYPKGTELWRIGVPHFSGYDANMGAVPLDAMIPSVSPNGTTPTDDPCEASGSIIECENQILAEDFPIAGTPYFLRYQSDRSGLPQKVTIPLSGAAVLPHSVLNITATVTAAGRTWNFTSKSHAANQSVVWEWDHKDPYGRTISGNVDAQVALGYVYALTSSYQTTPKFGEWGNGAAISGNRMLRQVTLWQFFSLPLNQINAKTTFGLGGLSVSPQNLYDPQGQEFYGGDGSRRSVNGQAFDVIETYAGGGPAEETGDGGPATKATLTGPEHIALGADGSLYIADSVVRKVDPKGIITTIAGNGARETSPPGNDDGKRATDVAVDAYGIAVGPDGTVYVSTQVSNRIRKIDPKTGIITTIAGTGSPRTVDCAATDPCGDGELATKVPLGDNFDGLGGVAYGPDGVIYFSETLGSGARIRRVVLDGTLDTATASGLEGPDGLSFAPDGSLFIADTLANRIRRLSPHGELTSAAGTVRGNSGDGGPATKAKLFYPADVVVAKDGTYFISDSLNMTVRYVDLSGDIRTITNPDARTLASSGGVDDGVPAGAAPLYGPVGVALASNGTLYIADSLHERVRVIEPPLPGFTLADALIPSLDGSLVHGFDYQGRHTKTYDATRGQTVATFSYDHGLLGALVDGDGNTTRFDRSAPGKVVITAPFGQVTTIALDKDGYARSITDPNGNATELTFASTAGKENGLLRTLTDPKGQVHRFTFSSDGLLLEDDNPAGGSTKLARTNLSDGWSVSLTSAMGRTKEVTLLGPPTGGDLRISTSPSGTTSTLRRNGDGSLVTTLAGSTGPALLTSKVELGPDPRWGLLAPISQSVTMTTTSGLRMSIAHSAKATTKGTLLDLSSATDTVTINKTATFTQAYTAKGSGAITTSTSPAGRTRTVTLDAMDRIVGVDAPGLPSISIAYNTNPCPAGGDGCNGRITSITATSANPKEGSRTWKPSYGPVDTGLVSSALDSLGLETSFTRDPAGRITGVDFPPLSGTTPNQNALGLTYDKNGNLSTLAVPSSASPAPVHAFPSYSPVDLLEAYDPPQVSPPPSSRETTYAYNADSQLTALLAPMGSGTKAVDVSYDAFGRVSAVSDAVSKVSSSVAYAPGDLVSKITTSDGETTAFAYDGVLPTSASWSGPVAGTIAWTYDDFFRVTSRSVGGSTTSFTYDDDSLLTGTSAPASFVVARDVGGKNGLLGGTTLGAITDAWTYDGFGEPSGYTASFGATPVYAMSGILRDPAGRITELSENVAGAVHTWAFAYDAHGDLVTATHDGTTHSYAFDPNGNRTSVDGVTEGPYDAQDRLVSSNLTYTSNGDLLTKSSSAGTSRYAYNLSGNLRSVELGGGAKVSYVIDGSNRRVGKTLTSGTSSLSQGFLYDDQLRLAAELDGSNHAVSVFVYGTRINVPDYMVRGGNTYRLVSDWRGSVRAVVDANAGTIVETIDYDAWGNVTTFTDSTCTGGPACSYFQPFGFAGGLYDKDTGLVRFGARDYDPSVGRWTQKDASAFAGGTNFYVYANDDPVNWIDLNGHWSLPCAAGFAEGLAAGFIQGAYNFAGQAFRAAANALCNRPDTSIDWGAVGEAAALGALGELASASSACFTAGTVVTACDGSEEPIETLRAGDEVLSRSEETGQLECKPIVQTFEHVADDIAWLRVSDADGGEQTFEVTLGHRFWVEGKGWTPVRWLQQGDALWSPGELRVVVEAWVPEAGTARVFNFEVEGGHSYFVGDLRIWVHNACGPITTPYGPAAQDATPAATAAIAAADEGATLYRQGSFGVQFTSDAQFWSLDNPASTPGFASQVGMNGGSSIDWVMGGTLNNGSDAIARAAPSLGANTGGGIEIVTNPGSVGSLWFHMP